MIEERDISVAMRDGTRLAVDVYRPAVSGQYPVLYASALHNKDIQGPDIAEFERAFASYREIDHVIEETPVARAYAKAT